MRRVLLATVLMLLVAAGFSSAGDEASKVDPMAAMANCHVCKALMPHMAELMPVMKTEMIPMSNGMATMTTVTDEAKLSLFHDVFDAMHEAGEESAHFTAEQADEKLCPACRDFWGLMAEGAHLSYGATATGDLMVLTADDSELQKKIVTLYKKHEATMGG
jgi:hypothetical protein